MPALTLPRHLHGASYKLPPPYDALLTSVASRIPADRLITDPLRLLTWGSDASFYRLVPKLAVVVESEQEVTCVLSECARRATPVTFRAAGTSLSGQSITDSVLLLLGDQWRGCEIAADAATITLQPGVIGAEANRRLARYGRKIGPDPASIDTAMIGGIAANNASGMCCGTAQNSYKTLAGIRVVLADGTVVDTRDAASRAAFIAQRQDLLRGLTELANAARNNVRLAERIRHKFRMKNTTGYSLNALVDFTDPFDVLAHLMIGSEGTLGFISEVTYHTVPDYADKASALILFDDLETACRAVTALKATPVSAGELADRAALRSVEAKPGMPESIRTLGPNGAALLVETRAASPADLAAQTGAIEAALSDLHTFEPVVFSTDPSECARFWNMRKGMFPSVGAMRAAGTTVIIEDVAFPIDRLAEATLELQDLLSAHAYPEAIIFGHALEGNLHFVFTQDFNAPAEIERYRRFMDALCRMVVKKYDGSLKAEHGTGRNVAPFVELEWGAEAYALMQRIKTLFDPHGLLNPGVIINDDAEAHLKHLKPMPQCDALVDKCIECGFCEPKCPSRGLTLSPRQRIVGWREIARLGREAPASPEIGAMRALYDYHGIDTCAACGLCATACPVDIETGLLTKSLRARRQGPMAQRIATTFARHFGAVTSGMRAGLTLADLMHGALGTRIMQGGLDSARRVSGGRLPKWSPAFPRAARFKPPAPRPETSQPRARSIDPLAIDPLAIDPLAIDPLAIDPLAIDPLATDPLAIDPLAIDHSADSIDPGTMGHPAQSIDPRTVDPRTMDPRPIPRVERIVYFPSCAARTMGTQRGDDAEALPIVAERLFRKAGFDVVYPAQLAGLCCGQPFESKGLTVAADLKSAELEAVLAAASEHGRWPIVFDTSPCAYRMRRFCGSRLTVHDSIAFIHDAVLPRVTLTPVREPVAIHPVCSVRKMGMTDKLAAIANRCCTDVVTVHDVLCCGFAGEKGFNRPELNEYALRHLKEALPADCSHGYSSSRTCEIGLSEQAGFPYQSIIHLVETCASAKVPVAAT